MKSTRVGLGRNFGFICIQVSKKNFAPIEALGPGRLAAPAAPTPIGLSLPVIMPESLPIKQSGVANVEHTGWLCGTRWARGLEVAFWEIEMSNAGVGSREQNAHD